MRWLALLMAAGIGTPVGIDAAELIPALKPKAVEAIATLVRCPAPHWNREGPYGKIATAAVHTYTGDAETFRMDSVYTVIEPSWGNSGYAEWKATGYVTFQLSALSKIEQSPVWALDISFECRDQANCATLVSCFDTADSSSCETQTTSAFTLPMCDGETVTQLVEVLRLLRESE